MTERLVLRRFSESDVDELARVFAKPQVWRFPYGRGLSRDETVEFVQRQLAHWVEHRFGCWLAIERESGRVIGYLGLSIPTFLPEILPAVEVGWRLDPDAWGRGYATEGARAALDQAFSTLGLDEVCSIPQSDNLASIRVCERLGMRFVRDVVVAANERRGAVPAKIFVTLRREAVPLASGAVVAS